MNLQQIQTIDEVIDLLEKIISESVQNNDPLGYFATLYLKVTIKVRDEIARGHFDDGPRMELFDVVFAKYYLSAYYSFRKNEPIRESWQRAFELSGQYRPIVLQHLLMGMNAHINFDLGIVAAEISRGKNLAGLENDFNKINAILSSLIHEVQGNLSAVWPALKYILKWTGKVDDYLVDFSMKLARDGAWKFAGEFSAIPEEEQKQALEIRDRKVTGVARVITKPGLVATIALLIIRITERGSVAAKIQKLKKVPVA